MKTPITIRVETDLLDSVRNQAHLENRSLTNFIETVLRHRVGIQQQLDVNTPRKRGASLAHERRQSDGDLGSVDDAT